MKRLLDEPIGPELEELLRSADEDAPSAPEKRQDRIIAAIATTSTIGTTTATLSRGDEFVRTAKWAAPLLGVVAAATFVLVSGSRGAAPGHDDTGAPRAEVAQTERIAEPAAPEIPGPTAQGVRVEDLPTATAPVHPPVPASDEAVPRAAGEPRGARNAERAAQLGGAEPPVAAPRPAPAPNIDAEIAAIDAARAALTTERPAEALTRVETYRRTFAAPHFTDEADAIEVQALAALGRKDEARSKANEFLARHARSPYAQRVRSAVGMK